MQGIPPDDLEEHMRSKIQLDAHKKLKIQELESSYHDQPPLSSAIPVRPTGQQETVLSALPVALEPSFGMGADTFLSAPPVPLPPVHYQEPSVPIVPTTPVLVYQDDVSIVILIHLGRETSSFVSLNFFTCWMLF